MLIFECLIWIQTQKAMSEIFIKEIKVNKVRHLHDLTIPISNEERRHLIITGKNGSGKTSLLEVIDNYLQSLIDRYNLLLTVGRIENETEPANLSLQHFAVETHFNIRLSIEKQVRIADEYDNDEFIICFFDTDRHNKKFNQPKSITKDDFTFRYTTHIEGYRRFLQYLVNLQAKKAFAKGENSKRVDEIDEWFKSFEEYLRALFSDPTLRLEFDSEELDFSILQSNKEKFGFNTMSAGYSAIFNIIAEIMMRMEKKSPRFYDIQGIVLIDEVETHLHIDLQKQILPFLTKVFPKIQFIVTTHSPFVLNSISNAVVYDLELQQPIADMSGYSVEGIIESYFDSDKYSTLVKEKVNRYEYLWQKDALSDDELDELKDLRSYFKRLPPLNAEELELKIMQIELSKIRQL